MNEESLRRALEEAGTIRGAAQLLNVDRSAFRRLQYVVDEFKTKSSVGRKNQQGGQC